jgi:hypothetical protein
LHSLFPLSIETLRKAIMFAEVLNDPTLALRKSWNLLNAALLGSSFFGNGTLDSGNALQSLRPTSEFPPHLNLLTATIQDLQACLQNGSVTSVQLTKEYLVSFLYRLTPIFMLMDGQYRIEENNYAGLHLRAVLETAPYDHVISIAQYYDDLRANGVSLDFVGVSAC